MPLAAILSKPQKPELATILPELRAWLAERGWTCLLDKQSAVYLDGVEGVPRAEMPGHKPDLVIVLGGDGTLLAAARAFAHTNIPLLSVNLGSLGFLTEVPLSELYATLPAWCEGCAAIEDRSMMRAELYCAGEGKVVRQWDALNDVVVAKGTIARMADFAVEIDNQAVATFRADGVILVDADGLHGVQPGGGWADRDAQRELHGGDTDLPAPADDPADRGARRVGDYSACDRGAERDLPDRGWAGSCAHACGGRRRCAVAVASTRCGCCS